MFEHWDSFYLLMGGAAGSLIGLLFIVATLTKGAQDPDSALRGASVYLSPVVIQLGVVLAISAIAAAPGLSVQLCGLAVAACGLVGLVAAGRVMFHLKVAKSFPTAHWTDFWWYGAAVFTADLLLTASAAAIWLAAPAHAARGIAVSLVLILLLAIRNAWDLVTWITAKGPGAQPQP
ncbi:MAG: hypothetical protein JWP49_2153 [Phenylobacterium sp.]|jgi:hypothetical protein|nr:hypothetical protein [Phenylobacterium sp.]